MRELVVVTYDINVVSAKQINLVRQQLEEYGITYVVVAKGITVEFAKPVEVIDADGATE